MTLRGFGQMFASWLFCLLYGTAASLVTLLTLGLFWRRLTPWMLRLWGRTMLRIAGVRLELEGMEHLETDSMKIAPFNHGSVLDAFLITAIMPPGSVAALKREALYYPVVGFTVYLLGFLLIDRGNSGRARATMDRAGRRMARERLNVFISPEGTRALTPELLPFKKGAFHLALDSRAPIVPVVIDGAFELHPPGRYTTLPGVIRIRVLPPRPTTSFTPETLAAEAEALRALYGVELARMRAERGAVAGETGVGSVLAL